jgi:hypothetical protein
MRSLCLLPGMASLAFCSLGCLDNLVPRHAASSDVPSAIHAPIIPDNAFITLNGPKAAHDELCANDGMHPHFPDDADKITASFCQDLKPGGVMPTPTSLDDLLTQLGIAFVDKTANGGNGTGGNPGFAMLAHSSALTARKVTTLTPTAFVFTPPPADGSKPSGYVFLAYDPGEQFVEVASHDPTLDEVNFYLVFFDKACKSAPGGCSNVDLLTPNLVTGWSNVREYESSTNLDNTIADCRQCHAPVDANPQILRMQEIEPPFTHWFSMQTEGGRALFADFHAAHGNAESYGPIPAPLIDKSDPALFAKMVTQAGFGDQPNAFDSQTIENELKASAPMQPAVNVPLGASATWARTFMGGATGRFIAAPYHDVKVTDPVKLATATQAYQDWLAGRRSDLPDLRDIFLDEGLRDMSFAARANADGAELVVQLCQQCHHSSLDLTITRENFLVDKLSSMSRAEKDLAIDRLMLPDNDRLKMPPVLFRTMTDDERDAMIAALKK